MQEAPHFPSGFRAPKFNSHKIHCFLGQLGWLHPHGGCATPRGCCTFCGSVGKGHPATLLPLGSFCRSQGFDGDHELRTSLLGGQTCWAQDPHHGHPTPSIQAPSGKDGTWSFVRIEEDFKVALLDRLPDSAKASLRSLGQEWDCLSSCETFVWWHVLNPTSSVFFCVSSFHCAFLFGVVSYLTFVATTAHCALGRSATYLATTWLWPRLILGIFEVAREWGAQGEEGPKGGLPEISRFFFFSTRLHQFFSFWGLSWLFLNSLESWVDSRWEVVRGGAQFLVSTRWNTRSRRKQVAAHTWVVGMAHPMEFIGGLRFRGIVGESVSVYITTNTLCTAFWVPSRAIHTIRCSQHPESFVFILDWKDLMMDSAVDLVEEHVDLDGSQFSGILCVFHNGCVSFEIRKSMFVSFTIIGSWLSSWSAMDFSILSRSSSNVERFAFMSRTCLRTVCHMSHVMSVNRSSRSLTRLFNIEIFSVFRWSCWVYIYLNRSSVHSEELDSSQKELTSISWEWDVFLPSCVLSDRPDLSRIGFRVYWFDWKLPDSCPTFGRWVCSKPNSLFHSCFKGISDGDGGDKYTFTYKTSPVFILTTFGIQYSGSVFWKMITVDRIW